MTPTAAYTVAPRRANDQGAFALASAPSYPIDWVNGKFVVMEPLTQSLVVITGYPSMDPNAAWKFAVHRLPPPGQPPVAAICTAGIESVWCVVYNHTARRLEGRSLTTPLDSSVAHLTEWFWQT